MEWIIGHKDTKQRLTIRVAEKQGRVDPEDVARALFSVSKTLIAIDSNMWNVGQPRFRWRVSKAKKSSPLEITLEAELMNQDARQADVVGAYVDGIRSLSNGHRRKTPPKHWSREVMKAARDLCDVPGVEVWRNKQEAVSLSESVRTNVERILSVSGGKMSACRYGTVEGTLRTVTVDPREGHFLSKLQIIERYTQSYVDCRFDPSRSPELHPPSRIVAYGMVTFGPDGTPQKITVEDFRILHPAAKLPRLEDLHRLGIDPTNGQNSADYVSELRDEE